jgi:pyrroloquinoline quinone biosynthesis protein D
VTQAAPETAAPAFPRGVKLRFDEARQAWILLGPERVFQLDELAAEVLKLVDGRRTLGEIADALAQAYDAPRETILEDVTAMLAELSDKGALKL